MGENCTPNWTATFNTPWGELNVCTPCWESIMRAWFAERADPESTLRPELCDECWDRLQYLRAAAEGAAQ